MMLRTFVASLGIVISSYAIVILVWLVFGRK